MQTSGFYAIAEKESLLLYKGHFARMESLVILLSIKRKIKYKEEFFMKHIQSLTTRNLEESMKKGVCGECQTSCQSACKTSCTVGNQSCEKINK